MTWSGYVALGTVASNVFTESTATAYSRAIFNFNNQINGRLQGLGPNVVFTATSANVSTYNAFGFFTGSSGGEPVLIYPMMNTYTYGVTASYTLNPYMIAINAIDGVTHEGLALDQGGIKAIAGLNPVEQTFSAVTGLTANAGGGQGSAVALTSGTINRINTVATSGDSVKLPNADAGSMIVVINNAANPLAVFPASGDTINGQAANASVTQNPTSVEIYWCAVAGAWHVEIGTGYTGSLFTESAQDNITAHAGGGKASATAITAQTARVSTVATAGDSVLLPASAAGLEVVLINSGTKTMQVFGAGTDTIDGVATGTGVSQMAGSMCIYSCVTAGAWFTDGLGNGYSGSFPTVSYTDAITAHAGGGQAAAVALTTVLNRVTVVGTAADSVALPTAAPGLQVTVMNAAASNSMNVFPVNGGSDQINALGANAAFAVAAGKTATFFSTVAGQWHSLLSA